MIDTKANCVIPLPLILSNKIYLIQNSFFFVVVGGSPYIFPYIEKLLYNFNFFVFVDRKLVENLKLLCPFGYYPLQLSLPLFGF